MTRPRVTSGPVDDIAGVLADTSARIRNLETVGHQHPPAPAYTPANSPRAYRTSNQTIPNNTATTLSWAGVDDNTWGAWSAGSPTLLVAPLTGRYIAIAQVRWLPNVAGWRNVGIFRTSDGDLLSSVQHDATASAAVTTRMVVTTPVIALTAGDSVYASAQQTSGGNLDVQFIAGDIGPSFSLILLA